jgi:transposase
MAANLNIPENVTLHWLPPYSPELNPVADALKFLMEHPDQVKCVTLFDWMDN